MPEIKLVCWNVNGIRAVYKRGFLDWLRGEKPDILCLQETKAAPDDLPPEIRDLEGYSGDWNNPMRKGYAGVATLSRRKPLEVKMNIARPRLDMEGRVLIHLYPGFTLYNVYFPNGKKDAVRLKYKMDFYDDILIDLEARRRKGEKLIVCGDYNTAHEEIDIARPRENAKVSGFLPEERAWLDKYIAMGYVDIFRRLHPEPAQYTFWDMKTAARERNIGWRIDYFFITENLLADVKAATILKDVTGSDHCPISLILKSG
ncbi:MAG: exodeoxyribonuclease III [Dehalococcoidales bacterium]|nr:exodeoxyribonuclease III [Dehalococcoidales bacterium]